MVRARFDSASVRQFIIQGVRPRRDGDRHRTVVIKAVAIKHPEHSIATHGQKGGSHALDVFGVDPGVADEHLGHPDHLVGPLLLVEVGPVGVGDGVGGHLMAIGVQILHVAVISPLVGDVKCRLKIDIMAN